jgi:hypothetical protein
MTDERIYVLVPETVQVTVHPKRWVKWFRRSYTRTVHMESGRLIAQGVHVGCMLGDKYANVPTIVLSVRNTKELRKVSDEAAELVLRGTAYAEFYDTNEPFYGTADRVHTITAFGPVTKEEVDSVLGHLELYV